MKKLKSKSSLIVFVLLTISYSGLVYYSEITKEDSFSYLVYNYMDRNHSNYGMTYSDFVFDIVTNERSRRNIYNYILIDEVYDHSFEIFSQSIYDDLTLIDNARIVQRKVSQNNLQEYFDKGIIDPNNTREFMSIQLQNFGEQIYSPLVLISGGLIPLSIFQKYLLIVHTY